MNREMMAHKPVSKHHSDTKGLLRWLLAGELIGILLVLLQWWEVYSASRSMTDYFQRTTDVHPGLTNVSAGYWTETGKIPMQISTIYLLLMLLLLAVGVILTTKAIRSMR
jgi:hypothetical protein